MNNCIKESRNTPLLQERNGENNIHPVLTLRYDEVQKSNKKNKTIHLFDQLLVIKNKQELAH